MSLFVLLWMSILGIVLLVYLAYPFFTKTDTQPVETAPGEARMQTLLQERECSYAALADLDEDYETGKLSEADYRELRAALLQETAHVIQQLETSAKTDVEAEIERFKQQKRG